MPECYISVDVETDGPVPGPNSLLQIGACGAGINTGRAFERHDPAATGFSVWLRPLADATPDPGTVRWLGEQGIDHGKLYDTGLPPVAAMTRFAAWIKQAAGPLRPVFVAYPLSFDWPFTHVYFHRFLGRDPFGFSSALDIKTLYNAKAGGGPVNRSTKGKMPKHLTQTRFDHTHDALDDARGQADLFANIMEWDPDA
jgi:hypothetical protein